MNRLRGNPFSCWRRLGLVTILGALAAFAVWAAPSYAAAHNYTGEYKGSAKWTEDLIGDASSSWTETYSWDVKVFAEYPSLRATPTIQKSMTAQGTITVNDSQGTHTCQIRQATSPDLASDGVSAMVTGNGKVYVSSYLGIPRIAPTQVTVTGPAQCQTGNITGDYDEGAKGAACTIFPSGAPESLEAVAAMYFPLQTSTGTVSRNFDVNQAVTNTSPCGNTSSSERITRTITASGSIGGPAPTPTHHHKKALPDPEKQRQKTFARGDLLTTLLRAEGPCGQTALGAAAGLWGLVVPGVGSTALVPAGIIGAAAGTTCATLLQRAYDDAQIVNDPPRSDYETVAHVTPSASSAALPACGSFSGTAKPFCVALRPAVQKYIAATTHATAVDDALVKTVDRETAAANARNRTALAKQDAAGKHLETQYASALRTEATLGAAVASLIRAHHVTGHLTRAQAAQAITYLLGRLAGRRLSRATLAHLAGAHAVNKALTPRPINLLSTLD